MPAKQAHLIGRMLAHEASVRPSANEILRHPMFWSEAKTLHVLSHLSGELNGKTAESDARRASVEPLLRVDATLPWSRGAAASFYSYCQSKRGYDDKSMVDFLRAVRNVYVHWTEVKEEGVLNTLLDGKIEKLVTFIESIFPRFVVQCWLAMAELQIAMPTL